jgi:hypothetical protein
MRYAPSCVPIETEAEEVARGFPGWPIQECLRRVILCQQQFQLGAQFLVAATYRIQKRITGPGVDA